MHRLIEVYAGPLGFIKRQAWPATRHIPRQVLNKQGQFAGASQLLEGVRGVLIAVAIDERRQAPQGTHLL